jgi:hypothetical protein
VFNVFEEFFAPGRKHTDEERNRLALTRMDVGDNDPSRGPIDLASGKVTMRRPPETDAANDREAGTQGQAEPDKP